MAKRTIKIRNENGLNGHNGTHIGECDRAEDGAAVRPEMRGLPDVTAAAIVNSREDWPRRKIAVGLSSGSPSRAADSP
jgi:hypothetical protein